MSLLAFSMRIAIVAVSFIVILLAVAPARAEGEPPLDRARILFDEGNFLDAIEVARDSGGAEGLTLAVEYLCYYGHFVVSNEERLAVYERAKDLANEALALDPESAFVRVQNAHVLGRYSQQIGVMEAIGEGLASRIRDHIDAALDRQPNDPGAHVLLAGWHAEIVDSAGFMGSMVYGADEDEALDHYAEAVRISPDDPIIRLEYALGVLKLDEEDYRALAREQLNQVMAHEPQSALERIIREEASAVLVRLGDSPKEQ